MADKILRIATRSSRLAIKQTQCICNKLKDIYPTIKFQLIPILTTGDKLLNLFSLNNEKINKGAFIKELEYALIENQADIAVHSMKDITVPLPDELILSVLCKRNDPRDVFISLKYPNIKIIPSGSIIGTSSLRRQCQIQEKRPDLIISNLRGNVDTRLDKLRYGKYDAIILAAAGMHRLNLNQYICEYFDPSDLLPAMGQGVIAVECRAADSDIRSLIAPLNHQETMIRVQAERSVLNYLGGYCRLPIASYAEIVENHIWLRALIGLPDGSKIIRVQGQSLLDQSEQLGMQLAKDLLKRFEDNL